MSASRIESRESRAPRARRAAAAIALALSLPALAYVPPAAGILRRMGERRAGLALSTLEVAGTLELEAPEASRLTARGLLRGPDGRLSVPARLLVKVPGRCRLELTPAGAAAAERPYVSVADGRLAGRGGLEQVPAAAALVRATCALLGVRMAGDAAGHYAAALTRRGVAVNDATLGRFDGRLAYVLGGREREARPLAFVDKETYQPLRLLALEGPALLDVRLLGWGAAPGGEAFPRAVEVRESDALRLRFTTARATPNARLADTLF